MDEILQKVEEKGKENNILKYNKMVSLREKRYKSHLQNQSKYINNNDGIKEEIVVDSSHIISGWNIAEKYKEKKRQERMEQYKKEKEELNSSQSSTVSSKYEDQRERSSEKFINEFVDKCFYALKLDGDRNQEVSRLNCARLFYDLMRGHEYIDAWDDKQFHVIYDLFQEDEDENNLGLDKNEFTKMIKRLAQL